MRIFFTWKFLLKLGCALHPCKKKVSLIPLPWATTAAPAPPLSCSFCLHRALCRFSGKLGSPFICSGTSRDMDLHAKWKEVVEYWTAAPETAERGESVVMRCGCVHYFTEILILPTLGRPHCTCMLYTCVHYTRDFTGKT